MTFRQNILRLMTQSAKGGEGYYRFGFLIGEYGPEWAVHSEWCGFTENKPQREIRRARLVNGEEERKFLHSRGYPSLLIDDENDLQYFFAFGGFLIINKHLAKRRFPNLLEPGLMLMESTGFGFRSARSLSAAQLQHAPSKKLRMGVLSRDGRRCLICGRSPMHYVDVELHVHHAVPWGAGGITEASNLITLCKTCHDGLEPHFDIELMKYLKEKYPNPKVAYFEQLAEYSQYLREDMVSAVQ